MNNDDNWKHRSSNMKCVTCIWWVSKDGTTLGRCRRHAPTLGGWPALMASDWCGDHKLSEHRMDRLPKAAPDLAIRHIEVKPC